MPDQNITGTLSIPLKVSDRNEESEVFHAPPIEVLLVLNADVEFDQAFAYPNPFKHL